MVIARELTSEQSIRMKKREYSPSNMRAGAIYRWNPEVWPEMFEEVDESGSKPGLTWRSKLQDIVDGSFIAILGPKNSEYRGIIAVGEALGSVSVRAGRDENIIKSRHDVVLRRVSLPIEIVMEILGEDIEDRVQSGMYLDSIAVEEIQMYTE
jgi:hypothetical protein